MIGVTLVLEDVVMQATAKPISVCTENFLTLVLLQSPSRKKEGAEPSRFRLCQQSTSASNSIPQHAW